VSFKYYEFIIEYIPPKLEGEVSRLRIASEITIFEAAKLKRVHSS
jgi:hypothetical protein